MFWRFGYNNVATLDSLLDQENVTLKQILNEDDVIQECRTHNHKLIQFLTKPNIIRELVSLSVLYKDLPIAVTNSKELSSTEATDSETKLDGRMKEPRPSDAPSAMLETEDNELKLAFIAAEIICCGVDDILELVMTEQHLDIVWSLLMGPYSVSRRDSMIDSADLTVHGTEEDSNAEKAEVKEEKSEKEPLKESSSAQNLAESTLAKVTLIPLLANNFCKINATLLAKDVDKMLEYMKRKGPVVRRILQHLDSTGIGDFLLRLMTSDDFHDSNDVAEWLHTEQIIEQLIDMMDPVKGEDSHSLTSMALMEMISAIHQSENLDPNLLNNSILISDLKKRSNVEKLCHYMLDATSPGVNSTVINGINVLIELLRRGTCSSDYDAPPPPAEFGELASLPAPPPNIKRDPLQSEELVDVLVSRLSDFKQILYTPLKPLTKIKTQIGETIPLGSERLTITEFLAEILRVQSDDIYKKFLDAKLFSICFDLFFEFPWNNLLHMVVCDMLNTLFDADATESRQALIRSIFVEEKLSKRILEGVRKNNCEIEKPKGVRLGYMGHITLVVDKLLLFLERERSSDLVKTDLKAVFEDEEWQEFIKKSYRETKDKESRVLGGVRAGLFGTPGLQQNQDETERSAQPVDVNTDQLARYMVSQIMSGFPPAFSVSFDSSGNDPFGSAWTELDDIKEYEGGFNADSSDPFTVPASNSTPNPVRESDESDESDEDGNSLNWNTSSKNDDPFSSNSSSNIKEDPFAVRSEDSGISSNEGSSTWTADFSKMKISDNDYEGQSSE